MTTEERSKWLSEVRARAEAASPAHWKADPNTEMIWIDRDGYDVAVAAVFDRHQALQDQDFIAAARTDIPALLAEIERMESWLAAIASECWTGPGCAKAAAAALDGHTLGPNGEIPKAAAKASP